MQDELKEVPEKSADALRFVRIHSEELPKITIGWNLCQQD
jgi:hypothetical protein